MFLRDDEGAILMDCPLWTGRWYNDKELSAIRDAGIETMYWANPVWNSFTTDGRVFNWKYFNEYLERARRAGMKAVIPLWGEQSTVMPSSWYAHDQGGKPIRGLFSPWHREAQKLNLQYIQMLIDAYSSEDVLFVNGQGNGFERVLANSPAYFDPAALADWRRDHDGDPDHTTPEGEEWLRCSYIRLLHDQMAQFVDQPGRELWYSLSRYKAITKTISCTGCEWIDDYLEDWQGLQPSRFVHINFNYFPYGDTIVPIIEAERQRWNVLEIVGAEYCEGLRDGNGQRAIERGYRVIVGPCHTYTQHDRFEPWMADEIRRHVDAWRTARLLATQAVQPARGETREAKG